MLAADIELIESERIRDAELARHQIGGAQVAPRLRPLCVTRHKDLIEEDEVARRRGPAGQVIRLRHFGVGFGVYESTAYIEALGKRPLEKRVDEVR